MFLLKLNKTGLGTMLVLLLLGLSLYPACGRPSFQEEDEDTVADEDHEEEDENQVDEQNEVESDDGDDDEENDTTPGTGTTPANPCIGQKILTDIQMMEFCEKAGLFAQKKRPGGGGGSAGDAAGGASASTGGKDEYDA